MKGNIEQAIKILKQGGIVIFPTDTAFGIGCRIDNIKSIERLFKIRKRPKNKPTPVLVDSIEMAQEYLLPIDKQVKNLIKKYWPGALTIILPCKLQKVTELVRGNGNTLGVRMSDHPIVLELVRSVGVPLLAPSANFQGDKTPFRFEDLNSDLISLVDFVLSGTTNNYKKPSTIIDCSVAPWKILRKGAIKLDL